MRKLTLWIALAIALCSAVYTVVRLNSSNRPSAINYEYIGSAVIDNNGSITLKLKSNSGTTPVDAVLTYHKNDAHYQEVLAHIQNGLKPGTAFTPDIEVLVKSWISKSNSDTEITADILSAAISKTAPKTSHIDRAGNVSKEFVEKVQKTVNALPANVRKLLDDNQVRIVAANYLTDALPSLRGQQPRGWPPGSTWDNVDGIYQGWQTVVIAEHHLNKDTKKEADNKDVEGVTRHEIGHAVNAWIGSFCNTRTFTKAYNADTAKITQADVQEKLKYFLQSGEGGRSETFAEIFAYLNGGVSRPHLAPYIPKYFPDTKDAVEKKLSAL
jgi:hypothetical protein